MDTLKKDSAKSSECTAVTHCLARSPISCQPEGNVPRSRAVEKPVPDNQTNPTSPHVLTNTSAGVTAESE